MSVILVGALILGINFWVVPDEGTLVAVLAVIAIAAGVAFGYGSAAHRIPLRPEHSQSPDLLGRGAPASSFSARRWARVYRRAIPANVLGNTDLPVGRGDPAWGHLHGVGGATLCKARR